MREREKIERHRVDIRPMQGVGGFDGKKRKRGEEQEREREKIKRHRVDIRLMQGWGWGYEKKEREKKNERGRKDREAQRESKRRRGEERRETVSKRIFLSAASVRVVIKPMQGVDGRRGGGGEKEKKRRRTREGEMIERHRERVMALRQNYLN